jgi:hypothetical protein
VSITSTPPASPHPDAGGWPELARCQRIAFIVGGVGVVVAVAGGLAAPVHFFRAWLVAFNVFVGVALGSLVVLMLQYLTGGTWGFLLRRPLEAATRTLPLMALLAVPLAFGIPQLYPWANPEQIEHHRSLQLAVANTGPWYLNAPFFIARLVVYFVIWNVLAVLLNRWSRRADETRDPRVLRWCEALSAGGMIVYVITITFASIDWAMSLEFPWFSTIYGAMFGMGQVLAAFAVAVFMVTLLSARPPLAEATAGERLRDFGSLMLAFVMIWAYLSFSQFLLIWSGNLPEEVPWYVARLAGPWVYVALALLLAHFALPFVLLLSTDVKRDRGRLALVALLVIVMRIVDQFWLLVPAFDRGNAEASAAGTPALGVLLYAAALAGIGGLWSGFYLWQLGRAPLLPTFVPEQEGQLHGEAAHQ